jgi:hypothetical protein
MFRVLPFEDNKRSRSSTFERKSLNNQDLFTIPRCFIFLYMYDGERSLLQYQGLCDSTVKGKLGSSKSLKCPPELKFRVILGRGSRELMALHSTSRNHPTLHVPCLTLPSSSTTISQPPDLKVRPHHFKSQRINDKSRSAARVHKTVMTMLTSVVVLQPHPKVLVRSS